MADMQRMVARVVEADNATVPFTMAHLILSAPRPLDQVDTIAVFPGLGEYERLTAAIDIWENNTQARHLLVAGTNDIEQEQEQPTLTFLQGAPMHLQRIDGVETQVAAEHTLDQAEWMLERIKALNITSMVFVVSHWHLTRAYCTLVKTMLKAEANGSGPLIPIFPFAVGSAPGTIIPELGQTVAALSAGEAQRILKYQSKGDVATLPELEAYLDWLWRQNVVPIVAPARERL